MSLKHLSLCSGIGGIDLAAEWAGFETVSQCEIDDYASKVLAKNFVGIPNFGDIRTITTTKLRYAGIDPNTITVISAGFPCQPYSCAGLGKGDSDERDLWGEVIRVIRDIKPKWFIGENTQGLFTRANQRYFRRIINDLSNAGYTVAWGMWGACDVGATHQRLRIFIVAYSSGFRQERRLNRKQKVQNKKPTILSKLQTAQLICSMDNLPTPRVCTGNDGIPNRVDRLRCLGNAVVPQQIYPIFKAIADYEESL